ncbi:putative transcriptional regulator [Pseudorhizobium tarimense]|uniref:Transcriptional regulator n=1 Tax=Pseudorhizobium tarimense TaxID=1079109 RepID=A0ABV2H0A5_9HYPH|nr:hypothetical protein [Pseudorhizobium tarimense]MCJ8517310.1 hypothetical protein [Pseudorhizobium tarimense]
MKEVSASCVGYGQLLPMPAEAAQRIDRGDSEGTEAEIAFESMDLLLKVLTPNRWRLLRALKVQGPTSIRNLS